MNKCLTGLGVPKEIQTFFQAGKLEFSYGDDTEVYGNGFHFVPATADLWTAGSYTASELIITYSAMEAIAYTTLNAVRYPQLKALSFIALGNTPQREQLRWIGASRQKRRITLVFGHDLPGRLTDIFVAAGIKGRDISLRLENGRVIADSGSRTYIAPAERASLNAFEKAAGIRSGIRTCKPCSYNTYLEQLRYDNDQ